MQAICMVLHVVCVQSEGFGQRQQNQVQVLSPDGHWQLKWIG